MSLTNVTPKSEVRSHWTQYPRIPCPTKCRNEQIAQETMISFADIRNKVSGTPMFRILAVSNERATSLNTTLDRLLLLEV